MVKHPERARNQDSAPRVLAGFPYSTHIVVLGFQHEIKFGLIIISCIRKPVQILEADYEINDYITNASLGPLLSEGYSKEILIES